MLLNYLAVISLVWGGVTLPSVALAQNTTDSGNTGPDVLEGLRIVEQDGRKLVELKLAEVLAMALERANQIQQAKLARDIATSQLVAAESLNSATLTNKAGFGRSATSSSSTDNFTNVIRSDATSLSTEFKKKTRSGIEYGLRLTEQQSAYTLLGIPSAGDTPTELAPSSDPLHTNTLTGTITVPLGQDFGTTVGGIPVRMGTIGVERSEHASRRDTLAIMAMIAGVYWNMVELQEQIRVQQEAVKLSDQLLKDNQIRLEAGVLSPADVKVSETQLARDRQILLTLQSSVLRAEDQARTVLNLEELVDYGLLPADTPQVRKPPADFQTLLKKTYDSHPNLGLTQAALDYNAQELLSAENKDRTNLDLQLYYTMTGYSDATLGGTAGFSQSDLTGYGASITWTIPLFDHVSEQTVMQKQLERQQLELQQRSVKSELSVQLQSLLRSLTLSQQEVDTAGVSVSLANELLQNEIERFKLGKSTSYRVSQAQQDLAQARRQEILARVGFERTFLDLLILTDGLFDFYGLQSPFPTPTKNSQ